MAPSARPATSWRWTPSARKSPDKNFLTRRRAHLPPDRIPFRKPPEIPAMTEFRYEDLFPAGPDTTPYRKLSSDGVEVIKAGGREVLQVSPQALSDLTFAAMHDIAHLFRPGHLAQLRRSEEHTSELQSLMRISYAVFCLKKK